MSGSARVKFIFSSLLGGFSIKRRNLSANLISSFFYLGFILFFELYFYLDTSRNANLIGCGCLIGLIFLIKLTLYFFNLLLKTSMDLSVSESSVKEQRPDDIPPEIWELRSILRDPKPNLDSVVSDLIATGVDVDGVLKLVDHLQHESDLSIQLSSSDDNQNPVINLCGHLVTLPFSRRSIDKFFPATFSLDILIFVAAFGFAGAYLPLSIKDQFANREKWWAAFICATSTYSMLEPPDTDPYITFTPDPWISVTRPLAISILSTLWRVFLDVEKDYEVSKLPFYDLEIKWNVILPYIYDILRYSFLLLPIWIIVGHVGQPLSVFVAILEAACRYLFGQNGNKGKLHLTVQILRGAASVACCWALLNHKFNHLFISIAIAVATFIGTIPLFFNLKKYQMILLSYVYSFLLTATSFLVSYCIVYLINKDDPENKQKIIVWFSFGWFIAIDLLLPYLTSCNSYIFIHVQVFSVFPGIVLIRDLSQIIVGPLFISACLLQTDLHPLVLAFLIIHATQKCNSEPHIFALAVIMTVMLFPKDFGYKDYSANLLISLLIASKLEIIYPLVNFTYRSRTMVELEEIFTDPDIMFLNVLGICIIPLYESFPAPDFLLKIPSMLWCALTGASFTCYIGSVFLTGPGPLRPFYFFDYPIKKRGNNQESFTKNVIEHPIETPVYTSACRALTFEFSRIARSGYLGYVSAGDIFLFKSQDLLIFVHVISIEASVYRIQCRGLEYKSRTICHTGEISTLTNQVSNYEQFPNIFYAVHSIYQAHELKAKAVNLMMYDFTRTSLDEAFVGLKSQQIYEIFIGAYCYILASHHELLFEVQAQESLPAPEFAGNLSEKISELVRVRLSALNNNHEFTSEEITLAKTLWLCIVHMLFNAETASLNYQILSDAYKGNLQFEEASMWIFNTTTLINKIIVPSIKLACATCFMANALPLEFDDNDQCAPSDMIDYINDVTSSMLITELDSNEFEQNFVNEKSHTIFALETMNRMPYVIRFNLDNKDWEAFKIKHEWVRTLWSADAREILFYLNSSKERTSIQEDDIFLNNLILQAADVPIGYPAYLSEILDSVNNPYSLKTD